MYLTVLKISNIQFARPYPTSLPGGTGKRRMGIGRHALVSGCPEHCTIQSLTLTGAKMHRVITTRARPIQTDEHHDNSATIRSNERIAR